MWALRSWQESNYSIDQSSSPLSPEFGEFLWLEERKRSSKDKDFTTILSIIKSSFEEKDWSHSSSMRLKTMLSDLTLLKACFNLLFLPWTRFGRTSLPMQKEFGASQSLFSEWMGWKSNATQTEWHLVLFIIELPTPLSSLKRSEPPSPASLLKPWRPLLGILQSPDDITPTKSKLESSPLRSILSSTQREPSSLASDKTTSSSRRLSLKR